MALDDFNPRVALNGGGGGGGVGTTFVGGVGTVTGAVIGPAVPPPGVPPPTPPPVEPLGLVAGGFEITGIILGGNTALVGGTNPNGKGLNELGK